MARFPDVYIRPAGTPLTQFSLLTGNNTLDGWDRLDFIKRFPKYETSQEVKEEYTDGTEGTAEEKISVTFSTFRCDKANYELLRGYHNTAVDMLIYDCADDTFICAFWGLKMNVSPVAQSEESAIINLTAERKYPSNIALNQVMLLAPNTPAGILSGYVMRPDGTTPDAGVLVSVTGSSRTYTDTTDAEGNYLLQVYADSTGVTYIFTLTNSGKTYPTGQSTTIKQGQEVVKNFTALT